MNIKIEGMDELQKLLKNIPKETEKAVERELTLIGQDLLGKSQRIAPKDKGDLRGSGFTETEKLETTVGYEEPYATRQHENLNYHHTDGQAKFLETPFKENVDKYVKGIGDAIAKAVDKPI